MSPDAYSPATYGQLIRMLQKRDSVFAAFADFDLQPRTCFLRHDVDFSLQAALTIAQRNAEFGVTGNFFLLLRSHAYNLLAAAGIRIAEEIHALGQRIGFHCAVPEVIHETEDVRALEALVAHDFAIVQRELPFMDPVFAWHNTRPWLLDNITAPEFGGLQNVYSKRLFRNPHITYVSDSVMRVRAPELLERVSVAPGALHILLHPLQWVGTFNDPSEALSHAWTDVLRFAEKEMMPNPAYAARFPNGFTSKDLSDSRFEAGE